MGWCEDALAFERVVMNAIRNGLNLKGGIKNHAAF